MSKIIYVRRVSLEVLNAENVSYGNHFESEQTNILLSSSAEGDKQMKKIHKDKKQTAEFDYIRFVSKLCQLKLQICSNTTTGSLVLSQQCKLDSCMIRHLHLLSNYSHRMFS